MLAPGGRFVMIHRPEALSMILAAIGGRLGALALLPVHPAIGASAHRLLVSGVKGSKAPLRLAPGLILHGAEGRLTGRRTPSIAASGLSTGAGRIAAGLIITTGERQCAILRAIQSFQLLSLFFLQLEPAGAIHILYIRI